MMLIDNEHFFRTGEVRPRHDGKRLLIRVLAMQLGAMTEEEFVEAELAEMRGDSPDLADIEKLLNM